MNKDCEKMCLCATCTDKLCAKYHCQDCQRFGKEDWHVEECEWTKMRLKDKINKNKLIDY